MFLQYLAHPKVSVQYSHICAIDKANAVLSKENCIQTKAVAGKSMHKKQRGRYRAYQEHIIVEIDKLFRQSFNAVHIQFDRMRIKGRQVLRRDEIGMLHDVKLGICGIQPVRQMPPGDKMDFPYPWSIFLNSPKPVAHQTPVAKPHIRQLHRRAGIACPLLQPFRIAAVYPCYYNINIHYSPIHCV